MYNKINNFSTIIEVKYGFWEKFCFESSEKITIFAAIFKENKL